MNLKKLHCFVSPSRSKIDLLRDAQFSHQLLITNCVELSCSCENRPTSLEFTVCMKKDILIKRNRGRLNFPGFVYLSRAQKRQA